jgi:hypothetical protein
MQTEPLTSEDFEIKVRKPKVVLWDVETAPIMGAVWQRYDTNVVWVENDWFMLAWSVKDLDGKQITRGLPDYDGYEQNPGCDKALVSELWQHLDSADVLIAHNGDRYDIRKANSRFIVHGLLPPKPARTVDTLKVARRHFANSSNKLDDLGQALGVGRKAPTGGYDLWKQCLAQDKKAWNKMKRYCAQDVRLLEAVYLKLLPWITNHPNMAVLADKKIG